jgi:hypothetical protein
MEGRGRIMNINGFIYEENSKMDNLMVMENI